ncbi:MAG: histidine kinase [Sphingomonadales bacterium]|nr:histidine kinase [Sphingomonadales bacterium]MBD3771952.1 histidine kinase [Paracoccaceae bacterium]
MAVNSLPGRRERVIRAFALAALYLCLIALFFFAASYLTGWDSRSLRPDGFIGRSILVDALAGIASFTLMTALVWRLRGGTIFYNIVLCFAVSSAVATADFLAVMAYFATFHAGEGVNLTAGYNAEDMFICWAMYLGWCCALQMLLFNFDVQEREHRLAVVREEALGAQMRALRYQINPHFLFNTLNSIAGLIEEGSPTQAERMLLSLSTFLRTTLALDPMHDVPLADELALQEEYLEIERERFSDRMAFHIDMPEEVGQALVPSLILQPLIENAIKHGVGATMGKVDISLQARRQANRVWITVENDIPVTADGPKPAGMGVGLRNIAERLQARFQDDGRFFSGPVSPGRYRASIDLPWRTA